MKQFCKNKIKLSIFLATYIYANTLDEININAVQNIDYLEFSNTIYNKAYLNTQIKQNHTLDELIKNHTNIRITTKDSDNSNSLKPDDFSINGAKTYQNQMFIDGINITSTIQPAMSKTLYKNVWYNPSLGSYSLNIDSEIIDNLSIYDSFVSASYGGFLGGVIDAKIKSPSKNPSGGFSLGYSFQDNIFIDDKIRQKYSSGYG
ncbi:TonB-dependent receptor plug domain-containing protein, partial [Campylobacter sp. 2018MI27]